MAGSSLSGIQPGNGWQGERGLTIVPEDAYGLVRGRGGRGRRDRLFGG